MESESSHSLPSPSEPPITVESESRVEHTSRKRGRTDSTRPPIVPKQRSPYWKHCEKGTRSLADGSLQQIGICKYCKTDIPAVDGSTSGLKNHLVRRCKSSPLYEGSVSEKSQPTLTKKTNDDSDPTLQKVASVMKMKFEKYWGNWDDMNPLIFIANVLDPRNKLQVVKVSIKKLGGSATKIKEFTDIVKKNLVTLWTEYKGMNDNSNSERQSTQIECDGGVGTSSGGGGLCDELFDDVEAQNEAEQLQEISNEVDKYLADEIEKRSNPSFNLLEWWKGNENKYQILSMIVKDIFAVPSSTVASESAFSLGKRVVDPFRSSLSPKMVEALVCTSDWLRAEVINFYKDPTDDDLDLYKEIEEIEKAANVNQDLTIATT